MSENKPTLASWALLILLALIWGSSYILIKYSLEVFTPVQLASLRVTIAFLALLPFLFVWRLKNLTRKQWVYVALVGLLGSALPAILFATAQTKITSSLAAILNALVPLSTLMIGVFFFKEKLNNYNLAGVILGIAGCVATLLIRSNGLLDGNNLFALLVLVAGVCYGIATNILKRGLSGLPAIGLTAWSFVFVGPASTALAFQSGAFEVFKTNPEAWKALGYLAILGVMGTAVAISLFNVLIQKTTALFASTCTYLIPVVAVLLGINAGEVIHAVDLLGLGCILVGIYLTGK